jgi:hypothetical protein
VQEFHGLLIPKEESASALTSVTNQLKFFNNGMPRHARPLARCGPFFHLCFLQLIVLHFDVDFRCIRI